MSRFSSEEETAKKMQTRNPQAPPDQDEAHPVFEESMRRWSARREGERLAEWLAHHERMVRLHTSLAAEHKLKAEKLSLGGATRVAAGRVMDRGERVRS